MGDIQKLHLTDGCGYIWMSDETEPKVYLHENIDLELNPTKNPFIVEGQLTDGKVSFSIRYADGRYFCNRYELAKAGEYTEEEYLPHRMESVDKLLFRRYWREEEDKLCCGMKVLQPKELVFVGFKEKEEKK